MHAWHCEIALASLTDNIVWRSTRQADSGSVMRIDELNGSFGGAATMLDAATEYVARTRVVSSNGDTSDWSPWHGTIRTASATTQVANEEQSEQRQLGVHPNPSSSSITIDGVNAGERVMIIDQMGRVAIDAEAATRDGSMSLDISRLSPGVYIVKCGARWTRLAVMW